MKNVNTIVIALILSFLCSCSNSGNLIKDYYFLSSDEVSDIGYPYGTTIYQTKHENSFEKILIASDIQKVEVKGNNILVIQSPNKEMFKLRIQELFEISNDIDSNIILINNMNYNEQKELATSINKLKIKNVHSIDSLKKSIEFIFLSNNYLSKYFNQKHYFIIDTKKDIISKPMDLLTFQKECQMRNIDVEDFIK